MGPGGWQQGSQKGDQLEAESGAGSHPPGAVPPPQLAGSAGHSVAGPCPQSLIPSLTPPSPGSRSHQPGQGAGFCPHVSFDLRLGHLTAPDLVSCTLFSQVPR